MDLKYIEVLCSVIEFKSFSKAAEALGLTQPTISVHIKALEEEFSTKLLDRLGRTVMPTQEGEILYRYGKEIMNLKENARLAMSRLSGTVSGKLAVGASTIPGEYIIPQYLARFKSAYPEVFPMLRIGDSERIHASVLNGEVDLGVIGSPVKDRNIITRPFLGDEIVLISSPAYRGAVHTREDLKTVPFVVRETGSGSRSSIEEYLKKTGLVFEEMNIIAEMGSTQALIQAVRAGMGVAFVSRLSVENEISNGALKPLKVKGVAITREFHIITHRLRYDSRLCKTFIDFLTSSSDKHRGSPKP